MKSRVSDNASVDCQSRNDNVVLGNSPAMRQVFELTQKVARSNRPVLISGPTGSGKEVIASLVHQYSAYSSAPFVAINCSAIPEALVESELFGYERGAFTGAVQSKDGYLSASDSGTLFLDEIAELPLHTQAKLLRVLENGSYCRVGSTAPRKFCGRVLAASHVDLKELVEQGKFREDLYYRLNVFAVQVPTLNERREDIPDLVEHFVRLQQRPIHFTEEAMRKLVKADWPGNVRQLRNVIDRISVLCDEDLVASDSINRFVHPTVQGNNQPLDQIIETLLDCDLDNKLETVRQLLISRALKKTSGNKSKAAQLLGVHRKYIERRLNVPSKPSQLG